jgi:hypothetical protein
MEERRKKGLCYNCDAKWQYGRRCQNPKLFLLEALEVLEVNPTLEMEKEDLMEVNSRWRREERKACVIIVMPNGSMDIGVKIQNYFCWKP